ncbi:unnamed protein product [Arctia plantaginis]|uniref:Uncharacterized protein n=1 Tax=Arctia plantaginis TaxID=874455 RepID=A0A8S0ZW07_ARCPL|nr:unnamed protein product [Arctia plantaginis]
MWDLALRSSTQDNELTALNRPLISTDASVVPETTMDSTTPAKITSDAIVEVLDKAIIDKPLMIDAEPEPGCSSWINNIDIDQRPTTLSSVFSVVCPGKFHA